MTQKDVNWVNLHYNRDKKLILKNVDYYVIRVKIRVEGTSDPGIVALNPGDEIILKYDNSKGEYTYNGYVVQQLGLNNGNDVTNYIRLGWSAFSNDIMYFMRAFDPTTGYDSSILIRDYTHPANTVYYHVINREGIDGGGKNAIIESLKKDEFSSYINIKRWNSTSNTDGKIHSFNKNTLTQLIIRNVNYNTLSNVIIRLASCSDKTISLQPGQNITVEYTVNGFKYNGCALQQIDFNNGGQVMI